MKRKAFGCLLLVEGVALLALTLLTDYLPTLFSSLMAFPFEQLGWALRALSLSGRVGNGLALALLAAVSVLPLIPALAHIRERERLAENLVLTATAILLAVVLRWLAAPSSQAADGRLLSVVKTVMGGAVWSLVICWAVLRLLRLFKAGGMSRLYAYLRALLRGLCVLFAGAIAVSCAGNLAAAMGNAQRPMDIPMAIIRFAVSSLPYAMDIAVVFAAMTLLEKLLSGERDKAADKAQRLSRLCCLTLGVVTISSAGLNVLQLILAKQLSDLSVSLNIPFVSLAFVLAALLLSRLIAENGRLSDENDSFI